MKLALVVPGGVDRGGERRVIPALLALLERLANVHEVHVYALHQERMPGHWALAGASIHNIGDGWTRLRAIHAIHSEHRRAPFDRIQAIFSGSRSEEHTSELQSLMRISYSVFCLIKKKQNTTT